MLLVSGRRCMVLMTLLLLFWIIFIGTFVSYRREALSRYKSKLGFLGVVSDTTTTKQTSSPSDPIPRSWLKDTSNLISPPSQIPLPSPPKSHSLPPPSLLLTHNLLSSHSLNPSGAYFPISFGARHPAINPNIIPHPKDPGVHILVAQEFHGSPGASAEPITPWSVELVCPANFSSSSSSSSSSSIPSLSCLDHSSPSILPIPSTPWTRACPPDLSILNANVGPHDARVFLGPGLRPFTTYGSQGQTACFAQFLQDFRFLVDWGNFRTELDRFVAPTEILRAEGQGVRAMEKNYFVFWDFEGGMYAHFDVDPGREFAGISEGRERGNEGGGREVGGVEVKGRERGRDERCWERHMRESAFVAGCEEGGECEEGKRTSVHQATNSLAVTMCRREDEGCRAERGNTFLFHVFQHKIYEELFRSRYEPFVMLFEAEPPSFEMHAIGAKPFWIRGRGGMREGGGEGEERMMYVTSMSWRDHGMSYQGFLDDVLFVTFGIDDKDTGAIDVTAEELFGELMEC